MKNLICFVSSSAGMWILLQRAVPAGTATIVEEGAEEAPLHTTGPYTIMIRINVPHARCLPENC